MPSENSQIHSQHRMLLSERSGTLSLNLSNFVAPDTIGDVELTLSEPSEQKILFQTAEKYDVSLSHDSALNIYVISGDAAAVAQFLKVVRMLPERTAAQDAIVIKSNVREESTGKDTDFKLLISTDIESGSIKTSFTQSSAGNGVSQVVQVGRVFDGELQAVNAATQLDRFEGVSKVAAKNSFGVREKESFFQRDIEIEIINDFQPIFTSSFTDLVENGATYSYVLQATDADGNPLTYGATNLPSWLSLVNNGDGTATLSGTPGSGDKGFIDDVELTVNDGAFSVSQDFFLFVADTGYAGNAGNNLFLDDFSSRYIGGGDGNDTIVGNIGFDRIYGGEGNDFADGGNNDDTMLGGGGNDSFHGGVSGYDYIDGGSGNDTLDGGNNDDTLIGGDGDDTLIGGDGDDDIDGGSENDVINGGAGNDVINGGAGNDTIDSGVGEDTIDGGSGNDVIEGENSVDSLDGGSGDDFVLGGTSSDILDGGSGEDTLVGGLLWSDAFIFSDLSHSTSAASDLITDYEENSDVIVLDGLGITGIGAGASEVTITDNGSQTFIDHNSSSFQITLNAVFTVDDILIAETIYWGDNVSNIYTGTAAANAIYGNNGTDSLNGGDGNDIIDGGLADDELSGDAGDDVVDGGTGNDTIDGGVGQDMLTGGANNDIFIFSENTSGNDDSITDFTSADDTIALSDAVFIFASGEGAKDGVTLTDDVDIFDVAGFAGGSFASGAGATFLYDITDGEVWYDADGNGGGGSAVLIATIDDFASYTYNVSDFEGWA